ncbi:nuclear transport factor 2 family protein [Mangrovimicrobium sediminis]|uniref:Nuclear transport factor 2 family protein n=1 Tax=Mangrovimicrobium sediminis TaxID=2562682 RepID=A0A4Z0M9R7_9GAMM|nr:nuclear transport factor 2 family protein [Haliea sp. SAOS-164]
MTGTARPELERLLAREKIRECIARLARAEDRRCDQRIGLCLWPDACVDLGVFSGSFREYQNWAIAGSKAVTLMQHTLGQTLMTLKTDQAAAETHVTIYLRSRCDGGGQRDLVMGGRYLDKLEQRGDEWRILERTMLHDWHHDLGAAPDWRNGLLGAPLAGDHYVGRTFDDFSEDFFDRFLAEE